MIESLNGEGEVRSYYTKGNEASRKDIKICHFKVIITLKKLCSI